MTEQPIQHTEQVPEELAGQRLDLALARMFPDYSRSRLKAWLLDGAVLVDGVPRRPRDPVQGGETVVVTVTAEAAVRAAPEPMKLDVVFEDADLLVINKPAGLVVHPAAGNPDGTLQNALLHFDESLAAIPRAGIVHRLDKDTTGLMVVARNLSAHKYLVDQIQKHEVIREYQAVVFGVMTGGGMVDQPIGRHPRDRIKMAVRENGREAVTHYRLLKRFREHSHIKVQLETGRTHQIRVHMSYLHHPIVGDPVYAGRHRVPAGAKPALVDYLQGFKRQALHAWRLSFVHPENGEEVSYEAPLPEDMQHLLALLQEDLENHE